MYFFTGDYHLKCTVNPLTAMSEAAISIAILKLNAQLRAAIARHNIVMVAMRTS
jgi:hypothetical protein